MWPVFQDGSRCSAVVRGRRGYRPVNEFIRTNALVVGGGTGMGEAITLGLAEGATVAVAGRRQEKLNAVTAQAEGILTHTVDVGDRPSVQALFDWALEPGGRPLLVNCAGVNGPSDP